VASPGKGMQLDRIQLASELWAADIATEFGCASSALSIKSVSVSVLPAITCASDDSA
jgi:hypothetical protein